MIDTSKDSNKHDLIVLLSLLGLIALLSLVLYLAANENSYVAGFLSASIVWKWKSWYYDPLDAFLEKNWPKG